MAIEQPPPRASLPLWLIIGLSGFGLLVTIAFVLIVGIGGVGRRAAVGTATRSIVSGSIELVPAPGSMADKAAYPVSSAQPGEATLNASNADNVVTSENETTFRKTFALDPDAAFSLRNTNGNITVTAWDQPKAEVTVIQSGSDRGGQVFFTRDTRGLSMRTATTGRNQEVRFDVKLPSELRRIDLNSVNGSVNLSHLSAAITIESVNGSISLVDVSGISKVQTTNGKITAHLQEAGDRTMEFSNLNGSIELTMNSGFDANLEASSVHGSINIADQYGIAVQKAGAGQTARGQIGSGGEILKLRTVNGSIRLTKDNTQIGSGVQPLKLATVSGSIKLGNGNAQQPATLKGKAKPTK